MTKEEYDNLLQSDYWKGYSYSLIKERNFTCEDCGRSFPNMRNMLQVHHLVYRDANPWSYKPEELIVLCKECHQKRHGIYPESESITKEEITNENVDEQPNTYTEELSKRYAYKNSPRKKKNWFMLVVLVYVIMYLLYLALKTDSKKQQLQETTTSVETPISSDHLEKSKVSSPLTTAKEKSKNNKQETNKKSSNSEMGTPLIEKKNSIPIESTKQPNLNVPNEENIVSKTNETQKSTIELPIERKRTNIEKKRTIRTNNKPKETTSDIWEKVNRKSF